MVQVVVTAEQAKLISEAQGSVEIVDENGNRLGFFARPFTEDDIRHAKERLAADDPRYTTAEVVQHLSKKIWTRGNRENGDPGFVVCCSWNSFH